MEQTLGNFRSWAVDMAARYPSSFLLQGRGLRVALTFDDGPNSATADIVAALGKRKCTFFMVGGTGDQWNERMCLVANAGHELGMHSATHPRFAEMDFSEVQADILANRDALSQIVKTPILLRPPYGFIQEELMDWCISQNILIVDWSLDSLDWHLQDEAAIRQNVVDSLHPGAIILMHSKAQTAKLLPELIRQIEAAGYDIVTVGELAAEFQ